MITRRGSIDSSTIGLVDDLELSYSGNHLVKVTDYADEVIHEASSDFYDGADSAEEYTYDANGNLTSDANRGIASISYNYINQPKSIKRVHINSDNIGLFYSYSADGRKLAVVQTEINLGSTTKPTIPLNPLNLDGQSYEITPGFITLDTRVAATREYISNLEYEDGELSRINTPYGYYNATDSLFYGYLTDRQGNIRVVYTPNDSVANQFDVIQSTSYYPYGMPIVASMGADVNRYKYSGKEFETRFGLNLYDFHARPYDPATTLWLGTDPLQEKKPFQSSYVYGRNNPIRYIDPDGRDEWELNDLGEEIKRIETKEHDAFFIVDSNNERIEGKSISFPYGTVERAYSKFNDTGVWFATYRVRGDNDATKLFEFVATNTSAEFSLSMTGIEGDKGLNFITTSHKTDEEHGSWDLFKNQLRFGYTIRTLIHSHPSNLAYPSGLKREPNFSGDIQAAETITRVLGYAPTFKTFTPKDGGYIYYNSESQISDFNIISNNDYELGEIDVIANPLTK